MKKLLFAYVVLGMVTFGGSAQAEESFELTCEPASDGVGAVCNSWVTLQRLLELLANETTTVEPVKVSDQQCKSDGSVRSCRT